MIPYLTIDWNFQDNLISSYRRACNSFVPKSKLVSFLWTFVISVRNTDLYWEEFFRDSVHLLYRCIYGTSQGRQSNFSWIIGSTCHMISWENMAKRWLICLFYIFLLLLRLLGNVIHECFLSIDVQFYLTVHFLCLLKMHAMTMMMWGSQQVKILQWRMSLAPQSIQAWTLEQRMTSVPVLIFDSIWKMDWDQQRWRWMILYRSQNLTMTWRSKQLGQKTRLRSMIHAFSTWRTSQSMILNCQPHFPEGQPVFQSLCILCNK